MQLLDQCNPDIKDLDIREIFAGPKLEPVLMYIK